MIRKIPKDFTSGPLFELVQLGGFIVKILGCRLDCANQPVSIAGVKLTLTPSVTNYIFVNWITKVIQANTTGFPERCKQLYEVLTDAIGIAAITDKRSVARVSAHTVYVTKSSFLASGSFNSDTGWVSYDLSSEALVGATGLVVGLFAADSGSPDGVNHWLGVRKPGETAVSQQFRIYPQSAGEYVSASFPIRMSDDKKIEYRVKPNGTITAYLALMGWSFG